MAHLNNRRTIQIQIDLFRIFRTKYCTIILLLLLVLIYSQVLVMRYKVKLKLSKTTDCVSNTLLYSYPCTIAITHINNRYSLHRLIECQWFLCWLTIPTVMNINDIFKPLISGSYDDFAFCNTAVACFPSNALHLLY